MKKNTLFYLEKAKGHYISGEEIARELGVSRMAVSKAVTELKKSGALIDSSTKCGYRLTRSPDGLHEASITAHMRSECEVYCYDRVGSTNEIAKHLISEGAAHATVIAALEQTSGRGRYGRSFYSPKDSGIYVSVIIKPDKLRDGIMYTVAAAVALRRVIAKYNDRASIKWVNDIYIDERKVCGILCEAVSDLESGRLSYVICGIGVNLCAPSGDFPDEIKNKAGYISETPISKGEFVAELADTLLEVLSYDTERTIVEYGEHMMLCGREIYYSRGDEKFSAHVEGIDGSAGLVVKRDDGVRETLRSGEVHLEKF